MRIDRTIPPILVVALLSLCSAAALARYDVSGHDGAFAPQVPSVATTSSVGARRTYVARTSVLNSFTPRSVRPRLSNSDVWESCPPCMCLYNSGVIPTWPLLKKICPFRGPPWGLSGNMGTLVVGYDNTGVVYNGKGKAVRTLGGLTGVATGIARESNGIIWATNSPSNTVSEFPRGATAPSETLSDANLSTLSYVAVDSADDVYVEGRGAKGIEIDELVKGKGAFVPISKPGQLGVTAGGLAIQKTLYVWVNDQGNASSPANISEWILKKGTLTQVGDFQYSGVNTSIWADPAGNDTMHVFAANNLASGSSFVSAGIEYAMPNGVITSASPSTTSSSGAFGISGTYQ
jgi:hypothetical protein